MNIAVLDLGSTTFHLEVFHIERHGSVVSRFDAKETLCLGDSVFRTGSIEDGAFAAAVDAAARLLLTARSLRPDRLSIVATSAIRSASNGYDLVREIERRHGVGVRLVGPMEEARLAYSGQSLSPFVGDRRAVIVDLGGGSLEIALGHGCRCEDTQSLPLGALRVRASRLGGPFDRSASAWLRAELRTELASVASHIRKYEPAVVVFGSGSARAVRELAMRGSHCPGKTGPIDAGALLESIERHVDLPEVGLAELGVEPRRVGSVMIATCLVAELLESTPQIPAFVSDRGLRDGVALETHCEATRGRRAASGMLWA